MNTDTPETDQWEAYCDECYYHMWRLRRKTERGWHDGFHIHTGEEAKGLCDLLNKLERELDELRRWTSVNGVIELQRERDELKALLTKEQGAVTISRNDYVQELERERDEARKLFQSSKRARASLSEACDYLQRELAEARGQRDRLAEVIEAASVLIAAKGRHNTMLAYDGLRKALQSLNQPEQ